MVRLQTKNEYIGKLLERPVTSALKFLKDYNVIKSYYSNVPLKYGGDLDHIAELNDGSFLHIEDMNFKTKWSYSEKASRIKKLPRRLKKARELFGRVRKTVLIITGCLTANREWMGKKCIVPLIIGEQITEPMNEKRHTDFIIFLARRLKVIIDRIEKKSMKSLVLDYLFFVRSRFVKAGEEHPENFWKKDAIAWQILGMYTIRRMVYHFFPTRQPAW